MYYFHKIYNILVGDSLSHQAYKSESVKENTGFSNCHNQQLEELLLPYYIKYLSISVSKFYGDVPFQFIFKPDSANTRYGFYKCRFPMSNMTNCTYRNKNLIYTHNYTKSFKKLTKVLPLNYDLYK